MFIRIDTFGRRQDIIFEQADRGRFLHADNSIFADDFIDRRRADYFDSGIGAGFIPFRIDQVAFDNGASFFAIGSRVAIFRFGNAIRATIDKIVFRRMYRMVDIWRIISYGSLSIEAFLDDARGGTASATGAISACFSDRVFRRLFIDRWGITYGVAGALHDIGQGHIGRYSGSVLYLDVAQLAHLALPLNLEPRKINTPGFGKRLQWGYSFRRSLNTTVSSESDLKRGFTD